MTKELAHEELWMLGPHGWVILPPHCDACRKRWREGDTATSNWLGTKHDTCPEPEHWRRRRLMRDVEKLLNYPLPDA
ncbi:hypothetical protein [Mycolicibacter kumamotonensis]|uniref:Uncharacterized protein n=1 Tax=Mycolicibacter kumamotonensis TaxID=354243 RepID=A0A1B8SLG8_9MYCO|nr:hypothetical protein [Mycolicibacter kumamotonensis]OBY33533.1 hypothetical protein ACT18_00965 [Mycolicibacter kumamotonensis]